MTKDEAWNEYGLALGEYVAAIDADDLDRIAARVRDLDQAVRTYAQAAVDAALSETLGLLEGLAKEYGSVELGRGPRGGVYALLQVECDTAGRTGLFYWNDLSYEFISRAEAEALLEVHDGA